MVIYNENDVHPLRKIEFIDADYDKIASLFADPGNPEMISMRDLDILFYWISPVEPRPVNNQKRFRPIDIGHAYNNADLIRLIGLIAKDPLGRILVNNVITQGITFNIRSLRNYAAIYDPRSGKITLDPTVLLNEFKINFLAHELVHALNPSSTNSIYEETYAEIIAMGIQDRITNIPISCHPYVVFLDRLESPAYGNLPLNNDFKKYLISNGINP